MSTVLHEPPDPGSVADVLAAAAAYSYDSTNHAFVDAAGVIRYPMLAKGSGSGTVSWAIDTTTNAPDLPNCVLDSTAYALLRAGTMAPDGSNRFVARSATWKLQVQRTALGLTAVAVAT